MRRIAFFNNKSGVGKTSLIYHLAWMYADCGVPVLAVDLDPQANLTAMFLNEATLEELWEGESGGTIFSCVRPIIRGIGDIAEPRIRMLCSNLGLIAGDLALSSFEDLLSDSWPRAADRSEAAFRILTSFDRVIARAAVEMHAELVLIDVGSNLGSINRTAMIATNEVVIPLAPDLFSLQGLKNLGPTLREWRSGWLRRLAQPPERFEDILPRGEMQPHGYIVMQFGVRDKRPVKAYRRWLERIPDVYRQSVLGLKEEDFHLNAHDPHQLAMLKHYRSLMPLAMEARKPMFSLTPSDGAIGSHLEAVRSCRNDFYALAKRLYPSLT